MILNYVSSCANNNILMQQYQPISFLLFSSIHENFQENYEIVGRR